MFTMPPKIPNEAGKNSTPRSQVAPGFSVVEESQEVPEPSRLKLLVVWPVVVADSAVKLSGWLPMFSTITFCGLSALVWPTTVLAKLSGAACDWLTSTTRLLA